jgi:hypothetical protein
MIGEFTEKNEEEFRELEKTIGLTIQGVSRIYSGVDIYLSDGSIISINSPSILKSKLHVQETP